MPWIFLILLCFYSAPALMAQSAEPREKVNKRVEPLKLETKPSKQSPKAVPPVYTPERMGNTATPRSRAESDDDLPFTASAQLSSGTYWLNQYTLLQNQSLETNGYLNAESKLRLRDLVTQSGDYIAGTFEHTYLQLRLNRNTPEAGKILNQAIQKAGSLQPLLQPEAAWVSERKGELASRNKAVQAMAKSGQITDLQIRMAQWQRSIAQAGSLIVVNGEHDVYPLWMTAEGTSAQVISLAMVEDLDYIRGSLKQWDPSLPVEQVKASAEGLLAFLAQKAKKPVYLSLSIRPEWLSLHINNLYPVGPLALLGGQNAGTLAQNKQFFLHPQLSAYIYSAAAAEDGMRASLANLLPALWLLKNNDKNLSKEELATLEKLADRITQLTGKSVR